MASRSRVLYIGVTSSLERRIQEHKSNLVRGFTARYNVTRLVYYEVGKSAIGAITREKEIKAWRREKKVKLIESVNPGWRDLSEEWRE